MKIGRVLVAALLALSGLVVATTAAWAFPATVTTALNVRSGPGTGFPVLGTLQRNEVVEVLVCEGGWCQLESGQFAGWASQQYLAPVANTIDPSTPVPPETAPLPEAGPNIAIETPNFTFSVGSGSRPGYRPPTIARICMYDGVNLTGRELCAGSGDQDLFLPPAWNDVIRSIRIEGAVEVTLCTGTSLTGECATLDATTQSLGALGGRVSSYRIASV